MPTYEYRCPDGHDFERFYRKISDAAVEVRCPECGKLAERRLSGGAGLVFKGSGFYLTDYGKNAHRRAGADGTDGSGGARESAGEGKAGGETGGSKPGESATGEPKAGATKAAESKTTEKRAPTSGAGGGSAAPTGTSSKPASGRSSKSEK
jgi:putative FmdB family regulatory protein